MWWITVLCLVVCVFGVQGSARESRDVKTTQGVVRGYKDAEHGIYEFYGIQYATAPTGTDRYKAPLPGPVWLGTLEANNNNILCPQDTEMLSFSFNTPKTVQQDCLITNVFVPDTEETNLPVVVYIHGGGFVIGFGSMMQPKIIVKSKKVIVVNFNYRLGALGFLCLGTDKVPGNAGLKDQVALLRWVKANIASFGGNPDDITVAGFSAGAMSADLLMLTKMTDGLITRIIPESGSHLAPFAVYTDPIQKAKDFAQRHGFHNVEDFHALENFYLNTPWEQLIEGIILPANATSIFSPCVERNVGEGTLLSDAPYNILKKGEYKKIPMLYGLADAEGILEVNNFEEFSKEMNENFASVLPGDLKFPSEAVKNKVAKMVKEFYFKDQPVTVDNLPSYVDYFSDSYFTSPLVRSIKLHIEAGHKEIYLYEYSYVDRMIPVQFAVQVPDHIKNNLGADHCAQSLAVFDGKAWLQLNENELTEEFQNVKSLVRDLWFNFITSNKPVPSGSDYPSWPPVNADGSPYMSINKQLELRGRFLKDRMNLWNSIYEKYYSIPSPPPTPPTRHSEL